MAKEKELQQKYIQFQMYQQQIEQLSQQLEVLTQRLSELDVSQDALKQLSEIKSGNEILANIAPGVFVKADLKDNSKAIVSVGGEIAVEKDPAEVVKLLEEQKKELEKNVGQSDLLLQTLTEQAIKLYEELK